MTTLTLSPKLVSTIFPEEVKNIADCSPDIIRSWGELLSSKAGRDRWSSTKLLPPPLPGAYMVAYFGAAPLPPQVGYAYYNKGWSRIVSYSQLGTSLDLPHEKYHLEFLYYQGLTAKMDGA